MSAFRQFPEEAAIIGRLLAGYAELEYLMAICLGAALDDEQTAIRTLFRMKSERVTVANALLCPLCEKAKMAGKYTAAIGNMRRCGTIRNQYAHSNFEYSPRFGLFFVDLQESAKGTLEFKHQWRHVDVPLLSQQEAFFWMTFQWWEHIRQCFISRRKGRGDPVSLEPPRLDQPPLHNPPELHIPPWTSLEFEERPVSTPLGDKTSSR